ncbi:Gibberellin-regulated protein 6 [Cardamine amara subsp. amara]|uniref:Gibberellin-regulated protein 6 n=1 Tax=Cardamine amara subsp. amara TaxID=228776 RepID=A0ABD1BCT3_CARAN
MAKLKTYLLFLTILFSFIFLTMSEEAEYHPERYGPKSLKPYQCGGECTRRCSNTKYHKPCMFFCQKCCATCLCVPPGTYGNKQVCPCYNNWKTQQGGPKCP